MTKKRTVLRVKQQTEQTQEPRLMNEIINDLLNGQTPFARARRHRSGRVWPEGYINKVLEEWEGTVKRWKQ